MIRKAELMPLFLAMAFGCGVKPTDYMSMVGDRTFAIVTECLTSENCDTTAVDGGPVCEQTSCTPVCENLTTEDVCGDAVPPAQGGCWITGGGYVESSDGNDSFGGNGMPLKRGVIRGEWEHVDHGTGNKSHGKVEYLVCRRVDEPGPGVPNGPNHDFNINQAYYGGPARWFTAGSGWKDGYWFDVFAEDHGEPGNKPGPGNHGSMGPDYYHFTIRELVGTNQSGAVVYDVAGDFVGGNFQIHPPNNGHPSTPSSLPAWVSFQP